MTACNRCIYFDSTDCDAPGNMRNEIHFDYKTGRQSERQVYHKPPKEINYGHCPWYTTPVLAQESV